MKNVFKIVINMMYNKTVVFVICVALLLISGVFILYKYTISSNYTLFLIVENGEFEIGSNVFVGEENIGKVDNYKIENNKILLEIKINSKYKIPVNSTFKVEPSITMRASEIKIFLGDSEDYFKSEDTVKNYSYVNLEDKLIKIEGDSLRNFKQVIDTIIKDFPVIIQDIR